MPLTTNHTKLFTILTEARQIKQYAVEASAAMAAGPVSANAIVQTAQRFRATLDNVVDPYDGDAVLYAYADAQFNGDPTWPGMAVLMGGIPPLIVAVIAACRDVVPRDPSDRILYHTWLADGSVSVLQCQPADTAALRAALDILAAAIPE